MKAAEQLNWIPDGCAVDHYSRRGYRNSYEGVESHRSGQRQSLSDDLFALVAGETREVGDVQRNGGPESDCAIQRRNQKLEKIWKTGEPRRHREHGTEAAGGVIGPSQQKQADA